MLNVRRVKPPERRQTVYSCSHFSNFILDKGKVFADAENANVLRFRSLQFEADMKFEELITPVT